MSTRAKAYTNYIWTIAAAILALHMLTTEFAIYMQLIDHGPTWLGLDDSARMVLNWAWMKHINWGHDIIYTYGPLSFLSTKIGWGIPAIILVLFDVFVAFNFFFLFRDFIQEARYKWIAAGIIFLVTLTIPSFLGSGLAWPITVFIFYWMYRSYRSPRPWHFAMLSILITIAFYLKLNTGLFTMVFLIGHLVLMLLSRKISWAMAGGALLSLAMLIIGCAFAFNVSLPAYTKGAIEVMKGYNDLLYLYEEHHKDEVRILILFWSMSLILGAGILYRLYRKDLVGAFLLLISFGYLFLLKKQGLFRNDQQHLAEFFAYASLVWLCGVGWIIFPKRNDLALAMVGVFAAGNIWLAAGDKGKRTFLLERFFSRYTVPYRYIREVSTYDQGRYANQADKRIIPARVIQRIGNATVDVFPWDANYILQNKLNYHPRPCFQTFQANSDYLQEVNYDFYLKKGPQYVIYDYDAIDGMYPFNDAPTMNLLLARNYNVVDTFTSNERWRILLERQAGVKAQKLQKVDSSSEKLDAMILPIIDPYLKVQVAYTLKGKARSFWHKPAPLYLAYMRANGEWKYYKTSPELLRTGLYVGHFINSNQDFARFVSGDTAGLERVHAIRFVGDPGHYKEEIGVEYYQMAQ